MPSSTGDAAGTSGSEPSSRIEDLLMDEDEAPRRTFRDIADQEVKSEKGINNSLRGPAVILVLFVIVIVVILAGWYQFSGSLSVLPVAGGPDRLEKRMAVPERSQSMEITLVETLKTEGADKHATGASGVAGDGSDLTMVAEDTSREEHQGDERVLSAVVLPAPITTTSAVKETVEPVQVVAETVTSEVPIPATPPQEGKTAESVQRVLVGPFSSQKDLAQAAALLQDRGFQTQQQYGSGPVDMIRLLEGIYPLAQAQQRLENLRSEFSSAFLLPDGDRWALYIGSFSDRDRARQQQRDLAEREIQVVQVDSQLTMEGPLLVVVGRGLNAAEEVAAAVNAHGLRVHIEVEH